MKIKYIRAKNFLAIREGIEIDFTKYGNIVQIKGINYDYGEDSSNGSGKSSIMEIIVYALYGKLIKGLNHKEAINVYAKRGLEVEILFDEYRVIRRREPNELQLWKNDDELTLGGIPATQGLINDIIGLNYDAFCNVVCFGQHNERGFLKCTPAEKRIIAENLLSLEKYVRFHKIANDKRKSIQDKIGRNRTVYETALNAQQAEEKRLGSIEIQERQWVDNHTTDLLRLEQRIIDKRQALLSDSNAQEIENYNTVQEELTQITLDINSLEEQRKKIHVNLEKADQIIQSRRDEKQELSLSVNELERTLTQLQSEMLELEEKNKEARQKKGKCPVCWNEVTEQNIKLIIDHNIGQIHKKQDTWNKSKFSQNEKKRLLDACETNLTALMNGRQEVRLKELSIRSNLDEAITKRSKLSKVTKPDVSVTTMVVQKEIEQLEERLLQKRMESNPFSALVADCKNELVAIAERIVGIKKSIAAEEVKLPYFDFWLRAFGDDGIRSFVLAEIMPALNGRINHWLQFLIDSKINLEFDNQLEEKIQRFFGDDYPYVYNSLSGGEHQRIDLAIALAFAHVETLTSGTCPSIINLDEVGTNLDLPGIYAVFRAICELSQDRQVLVTTHHPVLQELLSGYETILVTMNKGVTTIRK